MTAAAMTRVPKIAIANIHAAGSRLLRSVLVIRASSAMAPMSPTLLRKERSRTVAHPNEVGGSGGCRQRSIGGQKRQVKLASTCSCPSTSRALSQRPPALGAVLLRSRKRASLACYGARGSYRQSQAQDDHRLCRLGHWRRARRDPETEAREGGPPAPKPLASPACDADAHRAKPSCSKQRASSQAEVSVAQTGAEAWSLSITCSRHIRALAGGCAQAGRA